MNFMSEQDYNKEAFIIFFTLKSIKRKYDQQYEERKIFLKEKRRLLKRLRLLK
jgi:hypothetical protein